MTLPKNHEQEVIFECKNALKAGNFNRGQCRFASYMTLSPSRFLILHFVFARCQLPHLQPGDLAPSFALQTLDGRIVYRKSNSSSKAPRHPVILHLFTRRSAFLEALWNNETSLGEFIESSPANTHFVFMSSSDSKSVEDVLWMRSQLHGAINKYYKRFVWISGSPRSLFRSEAV